MKSFMTVQYTHQPLITLFADANFAGNHKHWYGQGGDAPRADDNSFLADFNDVTSSFIVHNGVWEFFADADFQTPFQNAGTIFQISPGRYANITAVLGSNSNDSLSSFKRVDGIVV
jgi:hypothetical protein